MATCLAQGAPPAEPVPIDEGKEAYFCAHARAAQAILDAQQSAGPWRGSGSDTDVLHYLLDIEIIPEYSGSTLVAVRVEGVCTIDVRSQVDGLNTFAIDLVNNLTVNDVTGNAAGWSHGSHVINVTLDQAYDAGQTFQVAVDYSGYPSPAGFGGFVWTTRNGEPHIATLSEPFYARTWWPCKDQLGDKATMQMHCTVPEALVAVSNGVDEGIDVLSGNRLKYKWHEIHPMTTYLASLAISNYQRYDLEYPYDIGNGPQVMPVPCYVYADHWNFGAGEPFSSHKAGCDEMIDMLDVFNQLFGLYPFIDEKYGVAETGGALGGVSMEHQTMSSMTRVSNFTDIMAHELGHQWWGNLVTCETWFDIWINEGFASYSEALFREHQGVSAYWTRMGQRRPSNPNNQVYRTSIGSVGAIFSTNDVYNKGAWVLHMLRHVLGDDAFYAAINHFQANHADDYATTAEFAADISASFGHDLTWFTDQWVMNPGAPDYEWNYESENIAGQQYLKLAVWQRQNLSGFGLITIPIDIRVTTASSTTVHRIFNDGWTEYYVLPIDGPPLNVEFDEDGGVSNRNWVLFDSRTQVATAVSAPPTIVSFDVTHFVGSGTDTVALVTFSENVGSLDAADLILVGAGSGAHAPASVVYDSPSRTATITYAALPDDTFTFTVLSASVTANGKLLDGEVDDSAWWDDQLLPSGDGQPGGDAVFAFLKRYGDADSDGDVDAVDFELFPGCVTGPSAGPVALGCHVFDFDTDDDVDLRDYRAFMTAMDH